MRQLGYGEQRTRAGQISFTKRAGGGRFPRYHVYVEDRDGGMQVNLHLDQKAASYEGTATHGGEYEGPLVEQEMARIKQHIQPVEIAPSPVPTQTQPQQPTAQPAPPKKKSKFW